METIPQERWQLTDSGAQHYERYTVAQLFEPLARSLLEGVALQPGQRLLDVACGTGIVARLAAPRVAPAGEIVGIDLNEGMLATAKICAEAAGLEIRWQQGDASALPYEDASFDVVFCQQGLQFFPDKSGTLREMYRVLAPGGTLALAVFGTPNRFVLALAESLAKHADAQSAKQCLAPFLFTDPEVLRAIANKAGINTVTIRRVLLTRRFEPSQYWLLQTTSGMPYAHAIVDMDAVVRAEVVRDIAACLKGLWNDDHFAVPSEVYLAYAQKYAQK